MMSAVLTVLGNHRLSPPSSDDLFEMILEGTMESHKRAENCRFIKDFLKGCITKELFKKFIADLYYIYSAIEEEMEMNKDHPRIAPIYFPRELNRRESLVQDLEYFYGQDWESQISISPSAKPYVDRIHEAGMKDPVLLMAHACVRYMGDLSGGQSLKRAAKRALNLPSTGEGLNFYQFENIHSVNSFKQLYTSRMNELDVDMETKLRIVDESDRAFVFNIMIFIEIERMEQAFKGEVLDPVPATEGNHQKLPMILLRHPPCQGALAACMAVLAVFTAWCLL